MFYIRVKATFLDLPADFSTDLIIENPLLRQDRVPAPYTTSFGFPWTLTNRAVYEYPDRVNLKDRTWEYDGAILGYGAHVIYTGMVIIQEISGSLKVNFQATDDLNKFKVPMNTLDLGTYAFGSVTFADLKSPYGSEMSVYRNQWLHINDDARAYTAGPIKSPSEPEQNTIDGTETFMNILWLQNNFYNGTQYSSYVLGLKESISPVDPSGAAHAVMYPQIRASELARILLDLPDEENLFLQGEMNKIVLTAHYHPNFRDDLVIKFGGVLHDGDFPVSGGPAEEVFFNLGSFQSTITAAEVFKALMNMFCMTIFPVQEGTQRVYRLRYNKDVINDESFVDWNAWLGAPLVLTREPAQAYVYGYGDFSEQRPKIDSDSVLGTIDELQHAPVDPDTGEQAYFIQTTDQVILKKLRNIDWPEAKYDYEVKYHGLEGSNEKSGFDISSALGPLPMCLTRVVYNYYNKTSNLIDEVERYLPLYQGQRSPDYKPGIMLYQGGNVTSENRPYLSFHNYDTEGNRLGDLSLAWNGPDGLIHNFHYQFKAWVEKDRLRTLAELIMSPYNLKYIDLSQKVILRAKLWWIEKLTVTFTLKKIEPVQAELIEAPIPGANMPPDSGSIYDPGSTPPDPTGTCYMITVDTLVFNLEEDDFDVQLQRPGEGITITNWQLLTQSDEGTDIVLYVCSEEPPLLIQDSVPVGSISGVTIESGGACLIDTECIPDL